MDWLVHNSLANMQGPAFLVLYGVVIAATLLWCWWQARAADPTTAQSPPSVPSHPDPYEIAYLRGGENEVTRVAVFTLLQRGYLQRAPAPRSRFGIRPAERLTRTAKYPPAGSLAPLERQVFNWFSSPRSPLEIFQSRVPAEVKRECAGYEQRARDERLLMPEAAVNQTRLMRVLGAIVILGLGGYKLAVALTTGHNNVVFLIIMAIVALVALRGVTRLPRLSRRGVAYLQQLRLAYQPSRATLDWAGGDDLLPLMIGVFGIGVLSGTPLDDYRQMFPAAAQASGSGGSCGSSCSSTSSCSSSGCGGGGGGGGGCGGCGGGGGD
jgi:uncharacterized protein (TIGR04222 family)